jgi:bifunctional ADP-heptose synthase (sugar kinase/adenylyltransferase)
MPKNNYSHSTTRSFAGLLSDRYADSLECLAVIGDTSQDIDDFCTYVKERDGYPVLKYVDTEERLGCASAVAEMARQLGARVNLHTDLKGRHSRKRRVIVDNKVLCRMDQDYLGWAPQALPQAKVVVIADYNWGVVSEHQMEQIAQKYEGQEIIADWHPSKPLEFYACATAIKSSWCGPPEGEMRPFIMTAGWEGMSLWNEGKHVQHFWASNRSPLDCCGAGDAVLAALGVGRLQGLEWLQCCELASQVAAEVCKVWGSVYEAGDSAGTRMLGHAAPGAHQAPACG